MAAALPRAHGRQLGRAVALLAEGLLAARRCARRRRAAGDWGQARLLGTWVQVALSDATPLMECSSLDAAYEMAEAGRALARSCRHAYLEGRARRLWSERGPFDA